MNNRQINIRIKYGNDIYKKNFLEHDSVSYITFLEEFGLSYGGYAALVAASREDQIYQCVIAGAAVTDPEMQVDYYRYRMEGAQKLEQLTTWDGAISPINEVTKVNVPLYILHGDNDQRVPPEHYYKYVKELEKEKIRCCIKVAHHI